MSLHAGIPTSGMVKDGSREDLQENHQESLLHFHPPAPAYGEPPDDSILASDTLHEQHRPQHQQSSLFLNPLDDSGPDTTSLPAAGNNVASSGTSVMVSSSAVVAHTASIASEAASMMTSATAGEEEQGTSSSSLAHNNHDLALPMPSLTHLAAAAGGGDGQHINSLLAAAPLHTTHQQLQQQHHQHQHQHRHMSVPPLPFTLPIQLPSMQVQQLAAVTLTGSLLSTGSSMTSTGRYTLPPPAAQGQVQQSQQQPLLLPPPQSVLSAIGGASAGMDANTPGHQLFYPSLPQAGGMLTSNFSASPGVNTLASTEAFRQQPLQSQSLKPTSTSSTVVSPAFLSFGDEASTAATMDLVGPSTPHQLHLAPILPQHQNQQHHPLQQPYQHHHHQEQHLPHQRQRQGEGEENHGDGSVPTVEGSEVATVEDIERPETPPYAAEVPMKGNAPWTQEEDERLKLAVGRHSVKHWKKIARHVPGRTAVQCLQHYKHVLHPDIERGSWTPEEDQKVLELVKMHGLKWAKIAQEMPRRLGKRIRERYVNHLDPSLKHTAWTAEEELILIEKCNQLGQKWSQIAKHLRGRSVNAVKNHWSAMSRGKGVFNGGGPRGRGNGLWVNENALGGMGTAGATAGGGTNNESGGMHHHVSAGTSVQHGTTMHGGEMGISDASELATSVGMGSNIVGGGGGGEGPNGAFWGSLASGPASSNGDYANGSGSVECAEQGTEGISDTVAVQGESAGGSGGNGADAHVHKDASDAQDVALPTPEEGQPTGTGGGVSVTLVYEGGIGGGEEAGGSAGAGEGAVIARGLDQAEQRVGGLARTEEQTRDDAQGMHDVQAAVERARMRAPISSTKRSPENATAELSADMAAAGDIDRGGEPSNHSREPNSDNDKQEEQRQHHERQQVEQQQQQQQEHQQQLYRHEEEPHSSHPDEEGQHTHYENHQQGEEQSHVPAAHQLQHQQFHHHHHRQQQQQQQQHEITGHDQLYPHHLLQHYQPHQHQHHNPHLVPDGSMDAGVPGDEGMFATSTGELVIPSQSPLQPQVSSHMLAAMPPSVATTTIDDSSKGVGVVGGVAVGAGVGVGGHPAGLSPHGENRPPQQVQKWTEEQSSLLRELVNEVGPKDWTNIAKKIPRKTDLQCMLHWNHVINPELTKGKGSWKPEEDKRIVELVAECGHKWSVIAAKLKLETGKQSRVGKQIRERFLHHLDPNLKKGPWTQEEEQVLVHQQQIFKNKWAQIAKAFPGRCDNDIKNHWYAHQRRQRELALSIGSPSTLLHDSMSGQDEVVNTGGGVADDHQMSMPQAKRARTDDEGQIHQDMDVERSTAIGGGDMNDGFHDNAAAGNADSHGGVGGGGHQLGGSGSHDDHGGAGLGVESGMGDHFSGSDDQHNGGDGDGAMGGPLDASGGGDRGDGEGDHSRVHLVDSESGGGVSGEREGTDCHFSRGTGQMGGDVHAHGGDEGTDRYHEGGDGDQFGGDSGGHGGHVADIGGDQLDESCDSHGNSHERRHPFGEDVAQGDDRSGPLEDRVDGDAGGDGSGQVVDDGGRDGGGANAIADARDRAEGEREKHVLGRKEHPALGGGETTASDDDVNDESDRREDHHFDGWGGLDDGDGHPQ